MVYTKFTKAFFSFITVPVVTAHAVSYKRNCGFFCSDFHEAYKYTTTFCANVVYGIKPKLEDKCRIYVQKFIYTLTNCMTFTTQIFIKITITERGFVNVFCDEFYTNRTKKAKRKRQGNISNAPSTFTKPTIDQHCFVEISYNEFRPNCLESMGNMSTH